MNVRLRDIAKVSAGQAAPKVFSNEGLPFVRAGHLNDLINGRKLNSLPKVPDSIAIKKRLKKIPKGSILFAKSGMSATKNRVYVTEEETYFVSHLAAVLPNQNFAPSFLAKFISWYNPSKLILDSAYPSIRLEDINNLQIPLPPLKTQKRIAQILDNAAALRDKTAQLLKEYDLLAQSIFLDMFGDPVVNPKGWEKKSLKELGKTTTGNTPSRAIDKYYGNYIEWIKTDNINTPNMYLTKAEEFLSEVGLKKGRKVEDGTILVTCIAGSKKVIGNVAITDRPVSFNQQINAFSPFNECHFFWYYHFILAKKYVQNNSTNGMKGIITKGKFEKIMFISPPTYLQNQFAKKIKLIEQQTELAKQELKESKNLFNCLLQKAFKGELV